MLYSVNPTLVRTGDLAHCTSLSVVGNGIRWRELNYWQVWRIWDLSISTHTAIVFKDSDMCGLMEMMPDGKGKSALQFNPFCNYLNQGHGGDRIISITRHPALDDDLARLKFSTELKKLWREGVPYDYSGCLKNAFDFLKDCVKDYYCSELAEHCADIAGFSYYRAKANPNDNVMPATLQNSKFMKTVLK